MNAYKQVIDIVTDNNTDWRDIVISLARTNPSLVIAAYLECAGGMTSAERRNKKIKFNSLLKKHREEIKITYNSDGLVPAIKQWRSIFGCGLKEAKDQVEKLCKPT